MSKNEKYYHKHLPCGIELAVLPIDGRRTTSFGIRILAGLANEPADKLGLARIVNSTIDKGTEKHSAQELTDAFDAIGAQRGSAVGRESFSFSCSCLPEHTEKAISLHAELLRTPTFPQDFCDVSVDLAKQELTAMEDDPGELARKYISPFAYGEILGRHELGSAESLDRIGRDDVVAYWRQHFSAGRIQVVASGAVDAARTEDQIERLFSDFGDASDDGRAGFPLAFSPGSHHCPKELEQEHILACWPGLQITDERHPVERLVLAILGDGMSSRLFTEVREKQGLVYWVGAWAEHPRKAGMIFLGASTTPARCDKTVKTLLREVDRLAEDVTDEELERAKVGIIAKSQTHGDITRARAGELGSDLFHFGRPVPMREKNDRIAAVTIDDVRCYLTDTPRDKLCILTLGPRPLEKAIGAGTEGPDTEIAGVEGESVEGGDA